MWVLRDRAQQKYVQRSWGGNVLEPWWVPVRTSTEARCVVSVEVREEEVTERAGGQALLNLTGLVRDLDFILTAKGGLEEKWGMI